MWRRACQKLEVHENQTQHSFYNLEDYFRTHYPFQSIHSFIHSFISFEGYDQNMVATTASQVNKEFIPKWPNTSQQTHTMHWTSTNIFPARHSAAKYEMHYLIQSVSSRSKRVSHFSALSALQASCWVKDKMYN